MLEFLRDYFVYFWNLLFKRNIPPSGGALTNTEADKKLSEANNKEQAAEPQSDKVESVQKEQKPEHPSPEKILKLSSKNQIDPLKPTEFENIQKPDSSPVIPQIQPTQIQPPISLSTSKTEPDERALKSDIILDHPKEPKSDSFIAFERLQQAKESEVKKVPQPTEELDEELGIEEEEIQSIVEDILNYEEDLPEVINEKHTEDELQKKIRSHIKALQEQENNFQPQTRSEEFQSTRPVKYASEEEFEDNIEDEE